jgi:hypothetical protein
MPSFESSLQKETVFWCSLIVSAWPKGIISFGYFVIYSRNSMSQIDNGKMKINVFMK